MTLENTRPTATYQYRQHKDNPRLVQRRVWKKGTHWKDWQWYTTEEAARRAVVELGKGEEE